MVKAGDRWEVVVLGVNAADRRISSVSSRRSAIWRTPRRNWRSAVVQGPVTSIQIGAFMQVAEGVEGMVHVGDISAEKRINHPQDVVRWDRSSRRRCWSSMSKAPSPPRHEAAHSHQP